VIATVASQQHVRGDIMPPKPLYLWKHITQHGRIAWYYRKRECKLIRLRAPYGSAEFWAEFAAACVGEAPAEKADADAPTGTLAWLIARYRETTLWTQDLRPATRRQRDNIFKQVLVSAGGDTLAQITQASIVKGVDRRGKTPAQARNFLDAMRGLFKWATKAGHVKTNPTAGVENPKRNKGAGFVAWTEEHVARYHRHWPRGTRQRVWLDVLLYTGLRRGDAVRLGRQHVRDGIAQIKTEKSGETVEVTLPILPVLAETLLAGPCGDLAFICGERGDPLTKEGFGNEFRQACKAAGVPGSAHGVRKLAATTAANNGATVAQLEAVFGWQGGTMASLYTRSADRRRLGVEAMHKLANADRAGDDDGARVVRLAANPRNEPRR